MRNWLLIACLLFQVAAPAPRDGGTLSGQIRSADGRPLSGISVMIVAGELRDGRPNLVPLGISIPGTLAQTDVAGRYHLENIPPGRYYIVARPSSSANGDAATLYPGVIRLENAGKVEIRPDSKIDTIDFTIGQTTVVRVRGRVFNAIAGMPSRSATGSRLVPVCSMHGELMFAAPSFANAVHRRMRTLLYIIGTLTA